MRPRIVFAERSEWSRGSASAGASGGSGGDERRGNESAGGPGAQASAARAPGAVGEALEEFEKLAEEGGGKDKENRRVSTTDPQARVMKQADGGFAPSYNVQINTDRPTHGGSGRGGASGYDFEQLEPGIDRVEQDFGKTPDQVVTDGGLSAGTI